MVVRSPVEREQNEDATTDEQKGADPIDQGEFGEPGGHGGSLAGDVDLKFLIDIGTMGTRPVAEEKEAKEHGERCAR